MTDELSSVNLHHLRELEKRFKKQKEKLTYKTIDEFIEEHKTREEKIMELANQCSYVEILSIARQNNIPAGPKIKMLRMLFEKELFV
jgi:hypothetical protein